MKCEVFEIMPEVTLIRDKDTNIFVVEGKTKALVIDTGYGLLDLRSRVEEITGKPAIVVFTHGHIDHAFGGHHFEGVYMNEADIPIFEEHSQFRQNQTVEESGLSIEDLELWKNAKPKKIDFISAGDFIDIGENKLEVISLKGHTPGSIGFLDRKHRILFSGDGLINHIWLHIPHSSTIDEYLVTLDALDKYLPDFDIICNGHAEKPLPAAFLDEMKLTLKELLNGAVGQIYTNPIFSGMIYIRNGCEVVYLPEKIKI